MPRLSAEDRAGAREIETFLSTLVDGAPPVLEALMPELRRFLGTSRACTYGVAILPDGCDASFGYGAGFSARRSVVSGMRRWVRASKGRFGLYDAARVERPQRNRVLVAGPAREIMRQPTDDGHLDAREAGLSVHRMLGTVDETQMRVLVCDGPRLLAWVGGLQPDRPTSTQQRRLQALVPAMRRRLMLEDRLATAALRAAVLPALLERVAGAAFVVSSHCRLELANAAGRARFEADPCGTMEAVREALARPASSPLDVTPLSIEGAPPCYLALERPGGRRPGKQVATASRRYGLTPRETEVMAELVQGASNRTIALTLGCAERTVEVHVAHLLDKIGAPSRSALIARFWMEG